MGRLSKGEKERRESQREMTEQVFSSPSDNVTPLLTKEEQSQRKAPDVEKANQVIVDHQEKKERKKRVPKAEVQAQAAQEEKALKFAQGFVDFIVGGTEILIERMPTPTPLKPFEKEQWGKCCQDMIAKYLSYLGEWQIETAFIVTAGIIFLPRLQKQKKPQAPIRIVTPEEMKKVETAPAQ